MTAHARLNLLAEGVRAHRHTLAALALGEGCALAVVVAVSHARDASTAYPQLLWTQVSGLLANEAERVCFGLNETEANALIAALRALSPEEARYVLQAAMRVSDVMDATNGAFPLPAVLRAVGLVQ